MKTGITLQELSKQVTSENKRKQDYVVPTKCMQLDHVDGNIRLTFDGLNHPPMSMTDVSHTQACVQTKIPKKYYDLMREAAPDLLVRNVNHWWKQDSSKRLVRTMNSTKKDGIPTARAILSDHYRRIDNYDLMGTILPILTNGSETSFTNVESCDISDTKLYLKVSHPGINAEIKKGDIVRAGICITNSEVGWCSFKVEPLIYRLVCSNGLIVPDATMKKYHIGSRLTSDEDLMKVFSNETIQTAEKVFFMKVRDVVKAAFNEVEFMEHVNVIKAAMESKPIQQPVAAIEVLTHAGTVSEPEGEGILNFLAQGGDLSQWGLVNAVTRYSQEVESYERATTLEHVGGELLYMPENKWLDIAVAAN